MEDCKHKFVHLKTESYWQYDGRNSRKYHSTETFFCENCLEEREKEKTHFCTDYELWKLPEWCKTIIYQVKGHA